MSFRHWVFIHMRVIKICSPNLGLSQPYFTGLKYGTVFHTFQGPLLPCSERGRMQLLAAEGAPRYPIAIPKAPSHPCCPGRCCPHCRWTNRDLEEQTGSTKCNTGNQIQESRLPESLLGTRPWLPPNIADSWLLFNLGLRLQPPFHSIRTCNCR